MRSLCHQSTLSALTLELWKRHGASAASCKNTLVSVTFCRELARAPKPFCPTISNCAARSQRKQGERSASSGAHDVAEGDYRLVWRGARGLGQHLERGEAPFFGGGDHVRGERLSAHAAQLLVVRVRGFDHVLRLAFAVGREARAQQPRGRLGHRSARVVRLRTTRASQRPRHAATCVHTRAPCSTARTAPRWHRRRTGTAAAAASATASVAARRPEPAPAPPFSRCLHPWPDTARRAPTPAGGWRRDTAPLLPAPPLLPATPPQPALGAARFSWQLDAPARHTMPAPRASPQRT